MKQFKMGDEVEWISPAPHIRRIHHYGTVIEVVAPGSVPTKHGSWQFTARKHESYIVSEKRYDRRYGSLLDTRTFWPPVKRLQHSAQMGA